MSMREHDWVCSVCGSDDVQCVMWVETNTNLVCDSAGDDSFCASCDKEDE